MPGTYIRSKELTVPKNSLLAFIGNKNLINKLRSFLCSPIVSREELLFGPLITATYSVLEEGGSITILLPGFVFELITTALIQSKCLQIIMCRLLAIRKKWIFVGLRLFGGHRLGSKIKIRMNCWKSCYTAAKKRAGYRGLNLPANVLNTTQRSQ